MDELEPLPAELDALLAAERPIAAAPSAAKARLLARLSTDLFTPDAGGGGGDGGGGSDVSGASAPTGVSTGAVAGVKTAAVSTSATGVIAKAVVAKLVIGTSVASLAVGGAIGAGAHAVVTAPAPIVQQTRVEPVVPAPVPVVVEPPPTAPPVVAVEPEPKPVVAVQPKPVTADQQLSLEKSYLEQARAAMARQDVNAALEALGQHAARFPRGQLTEERLAMQVLALTSAGRSIEAKNAADAFRAKFPNGLFRSAVDAASPP